MLQALCKWPMDKKLVSTSSKFLALVLRHEPQRIGLSLDEGVWASVLELIERASSAGGTLTADSLKEVVEQNDKGRFSLSEDGLRIRDQGLTSRGRQHVHLSPDEPTARRVGQRHGKPVVLRIQSGEMCADGYEFFLSENSVWLTGEVPPQYIDISNRT